MLFMAAAGVEGMVRQADGPYTAAAVAAEIPVAAPLLEAIHNGEAVAVAPVILSPQQLVERPYMAVLAVLALLEQQQPQRAHLRAAAGAAVIQELPALAVLAVVKFKGMYRGTTLMEASSLFSYTCRPPSLAVYTSTATGGATTLWH